MIRGVAACLAAALVATACAADRPVSAPLADWPTYHLDVGRSGVLAGSERFQSAGWSWGSGALDGDVYASPIVAGGLVVVATENDTLYAFDARSGAPRWSRHLGDPVDASTLPCGDIRPITGITGTPVADPSSGLVYVVAFVRPGRHLLYSVALDGGRVKGSVPIDPPADPPATEQQRGALALASGTVYVPFGGLTGDCGQYHGWVVGAPLSGAAAISYRVPCGRACGLWAPGGPTVDAGGDLWVASGNSDSTTTFDYANAVLRLTPDLGLRDWFAPSDWAALSASDQDLGSISPALLDGGLAWISGKDGTGYLLRRDRLGHAGGQIASTRACPSFGGTSYSAPVLYLACSGEVAAVAVDPAAPAASVTWRTALDSPGSPIVAYGAVWVVETGTGRLTALDPRDGHRLSSYSGRSAMHFATPAAAGGRVYAALGRELVALEVRTSH
jgi:outer membrane protein assembly factor BamB